MTLPAITKTWLQSSTTITAGASTAATIKASWIALWDGLKSLGCTHVASSNGVTTSTSSDLWASASDIVIQTTTHSWLIFQMPVTGRQYMIDLDVSTNTQNVLLYASASGGWTGAGAGTTSAPPTASDQWVVGTGAAAAGMALPSNVNQAIHIFMSDDGELFRIYFCRSNVCPATWILDKFRPVLTNPSALTSPYVNGIKSTTSAADAPLIASLGGSGSAMAIRQSTSTVQAQFLQPYNTTSDSIVARGATKNTFVGASVYDVGPIAVAVIDTSYRGVMGTMVDLFYAPSALTTGDTAPTGGGAAQFCVFGDLLQPCNTAPNCNP